MVKHLVRYRFFVKFLFFIRLEQYILNFHKGKDTFYFFDKRFLFLTKSYDYLSFLTKHKAKFLTKKG